jgi:hypothetical protein
MLTVLTQNSRPCAEKEIAEGHEAMHDLTRARETAVMDLRAMFAASLLPLHDHRIELR